MKNVLITGASRGIGKAIAEEFAKRKYNIYLTCKNNIEELTKDRMKYIELYNIECEVFQCDGADPYQVEKIFAMLPEINVLINNAGISYVGLLTDMSYDEWKQIIDTNLNSVFYTCVNALKSMVRKKAGKIINISSVWGCVGASMEVAYSTTKGGINSFTKALAKEVAPSNIQVNAIACGFIDTEMNKCFSEEDRQLIRDEIPADRFGETTEVAAFVCDIVEGSNYLNGQIIKFDGAWI